MCQFKERQGWLSLSISTTKPVASYIDQVLVSLDVNSYIPETLMQKNNKDIHKKLASWRYAQKLMMDNNE